MSAKYDITIKQGSSFVFSGQLITRLTNTPRDLTGFDIRSHLRKTYESEPFTAFDISIEDAEEGRWVSQLSSTVTETLDPGCYVYDIEIFSGSTVDRFLEGKATITPEVTRED